MFEGDHMNTLTTQTLPFDAPGDHIVLIAGNGQRLLLDTGSPVTLGGETVELLGHSHRLDGEMSQVDLGRLGELVGTRVDGLIGTDVLAQVPFTIDWGSRTVVFHAVPASADAVVSVSALHGVPEVECRIAGRIVRAFVDTGASVSFLASPWAGLPEPTGERHEFCLGPSGFEEFDTPLWRLPVECAKRFDATFGQLPIALQPILAKAGIEAVLGADLWKQFQTGFNISGGRLVLS
jgi:hypothetical protein